MDTGGVSVICDQLHLVSTPPCPQLTNGSKWWGNESEWAAAAAAAAAVIRCISATSSPVSFNFAAQARQLNLGVLCAVA